MKRVIRAALGIALTGVGQVLALPTLADGASEHNCARRFPTIYLVLDHRPALASADIYLSDQCPGRVHDWSAIERLTAQTIQQVGPAALASLAPVCVELNSRCTGYPDDGECIRIPPVFVRPIRVQSCPPRELPLQAAVPQSPGGVIRLPSADGDGNLRHCQAPRFSLDERGRRYITGLRLAGCSAVLSHPQAVSTVEFGGASLEFADGFFDHKSFAAPHVVTRLQGSVDGSGRVHGLGFPLADLRRNWTHAYAVEIDLEPQARGGER